MTKVWRGKHQVVLGGFIHGLPASRPAGASKIIGESALFRREGGIKLNTLGVKER